MGFAKSKDVSVELYIDGAWHACANGIRSIVESHSIGSDGLPRHVFIIKGHRYAGDKVQDWFFNFDQEISQCKIRQIVGGYIKEGLAEIERAECGMNSTLYERTDISATLIIKKGMVI